VLVEQQVLRVV
jgi:hypothetical protein